MPGRGFGDLGPGVCVASTLSNSVIIKTSTILLIPANRAEDQWDWGAAHVPSGLTDECLDILRVSKHPCILLVTLFLKPYVASSQMSLTPHLFPIFRRKNGENDGKLRDDARRIS